MSTVLDAGAATQTAAATTTATGTTQTGQTHTGATQTDSTVQTGSSGTQSAAVQPFHSEWLKADGSLNHEVYGRLPEDVRHVGETLSRYKTAEELVRGVAHLQTLAGKKGLAPLPEGAPAEAKQARKELLDSINGVPKTAGDYGLKKPDDLPAELWNESMATGVSEIAHKYSISPAAVKEMAALNATLIKESVAAQEDYAKKFYADHDTAWQNQLRTENVALEQGNTMAERGARMLGLDLEKPEHQALMKNSMVKMMAMRHARATSEDSMIRGEGKQSVAADPTTAANDIVHNKANPMNAVYWDKQHPQHKAVVERVNGFYREASEAQKGNKR